MKKLFYFLSILAFSVLSAEVNTFIGENESSWHTPSNWSLGVVPAPNTSEIVIPLGKTVNIMQGQTHYAHWGNITGQGRINIYGKFNKVLGCTGCGQFSIYGVQVFNYGEINSYWENGHGGQTTTMWFVIRNGSVVTNETGGVMNIGTNLGSDGVVDYIHLINRGTIRATETHPDSFKYINIGLRNEGGTIEFAAGARYQFDSTYSHHELINPVFNIEENVQLVYRARSYWEGTATGFNNGKFEFNTKPKFVEEGKIFHNNIEGNGIEMGFGSIEGPGTFVNNTKFTLYNSSGSKQIRNMTFENNGDFIIDEEGAHTNTRLINSNFINREEGEFLIHGKFMIDNETSTLDNYGAIRNYYDDSVVMGFNINNYGLIENHTNGLFYLAIGAELINHETGLIHGYKFSFSGQPDKFLNKGKVAPGIDGVGTMIVHSAYDRFEQSETGSIEFEINSLTEFDILQGDFGNDSNIGGKIEVILGFAPSIGDEFPIMTTDRVINLNLVEPVTASYNGYTYTFDTILSNGNKDLILKLSNIELATDEQTLNNISVYPNPTKSDVYISINKPHFHVVVEIFNMTGQLVAKEIVESSTFSVKLPAAKGVYLLKLITKEGIVTKKIIKK